MYIKITGKPRDIGKVIEVQEFDYRIEKVNPANVDVEKMGLTDMTKVEFFGVWGKKEPAPDEPVWAVVLTMPDGDKERAIVAADASIYVMGDDGKTVDVIRH